MYESIKGYCKEEDEWRRKGAGRGSDEESKCLMNDKDRKCAADDFESALQISQSPRLPIAKRDSPLSLQQQQQQQQQTQRLVSLDVFRGLTVAVILLFYLFFKSSFSVRICLLLHSLEEEKTKMHGVLIIKSAENLSFAIYMLYICIYSVFEVSPYSLCVGKETTCLLNF